MPTKQKIEEWTEVTTGDFKGDLRKRYEAMVAAAAASTKARKAFLEVAEPLAAKKAPKGKVPVLVYKFGKLSLGFKDAPSGKSTSGTTAISL